MRKKFALITAFVLLLVSVAGTVAFLADKTENVVNTFQATEVTSYVHETFTNGTKTNVYIENTGDIPAYIRAAIVVNWVDPTDSTKILGVKPTESDYTMVLNIPSEPTSDPHWIEGNDGYYYYPSPVDPGQFTADLIESCSLKTGVTPPDGYVLSVEILSSAIQAQPANVVKDVWGYTPSN